MEADGRTEAEVNTLIGDLLQRSVNLSRKNRRMLRLLAVCLVLVAGLTFGQTYLALRIDHTNYATCQRVNQQRANEIALWSHVLAAPVPGLPADATSEQRTTYNQNQQLRVQFEQDLHKFFDPLKCT